jgi:hypothetical protein
VYAGPQGASIDDRGRPRVAWRDRTGTYDARAPASDGGSAAR